MKTSFILLLSLVSFSLPLMAKDRPFIDEPDNTIREDFVEKEWKEGDITLPQGYTADNLQEFLLEDANGRFHYFIDRSSLKTYSDGVSRFILVIRSQSGAENSSYEGFRCGEREYKVYAFGSNKGLKPIPSPSWKRISKSGRENYRNRLYSNLICDLNTGKPNPPHEVFQAMKNHKTVNNHILYQD